MAVQDLNVMAFPKLTEEQITQLARYAGASTKTFRAGEALFRAGDRAPKFFVIKSGELEIIDVIGDHPKTIRVQGPGDFTGDIGHLTGSPKVVSAIARSDCEVYEMSEAELRKVLNQDPQISDLILQAFIARRQLMRESPEFTGLRVIGSRYSRDTFRIRDFLAKNRVLFTWLDLEGDPAVKEVLQQFGVTEADTPIVACAHCLVLRNPSNRELEEGENVVAKCLLIATGAEYRRLEVEHCSRFEGAGVYYAATPNEAQMCRGSDVVLVGGGNSAGQAAVYLSQNVHKVFLLLRGDDLCKSMSSYLAHRIMNTPNIEILRCTEVIRMNGDGHLNSVEILNKTTGEEKMLPTPALFSFIGATPRTDWLPSEIEKDEKHFVRTGIELGDSRHWTLKRQPFLLETSRPGVFAAGDVRSGSVKRVASAVGEGSMAVQFVHEYLKTM